MLFYCGQRFFLSVWVSVLWAVKCQMYLFFDVFMLFWCINKIHCDISCLRLRLFNQGQESVDRFVFTAVVKKAACGIPGVCVSFAFYLAYLALVA